MTMVIRSDELKIRAGIAPAPYAGPSLPSASHSTPHTRYSQTHPSPRPSDPHKTDPPAHAAKSPQLSVPCGKPHPRPAHRDKTSHSSAGTAHSPRPSPNAKYQSSA